MELSSSPAHHVVSAAHNRHPHMRVNMHGPDGQARAAVKAEFELNNPNPSPNSKARVVCAAAQWPGAPRHRGHAQTRKAPGGSKRVQFR